MITGSRLCRRPFSPTHLNPHCSRHFSCLHTRRPEVSEQGAPTLIRPRRRSPNAVCHFLQKLKISSKYSPPGSPIRSFFVLFCTLFHESGPRGPGPHPKVPTRHQHGPQGYPNGAQGCPNEAPRSPPSAQTPLNYTPCVSKWKPKVPQWSQKATQSPKETTRPCKVPQRHPQVPTSTTRHERIG